jgi:hypothetical protein
MYQTAFYPLRTIVGDAIEIVGKKKPEILVIEESVESKSLDIEYEFDHSASLTATMSNTHYQRHLPIFEVFGAEPGIAFLLGGARPKHRACGAWPVHQYRFGAWSNPARRDGTAHPQHVPGLGQPVRQRLPSLLATAR